MQVLNLVCNRFLSSIFVLAFLLCAGHTAFAQQAPDRYVASAAVTVFGGYANVAPDYGPTHNNGFFAGIDYSRSFRHLPVVPSFELRGGEAKGTSVNEGTGLIGPKVSFTVLRRIHPYANFLVGFGDIYYNQPFVVGYLHDSSVVKSVGGGVDFDLRFHLQAKIDYQYQFWNTGENQTYTPTVFGAGLAYRIPIRTGN